MREHVDHRRLPLGVPGGLERGALELAERLIRQPGSSRAAGQGVEFEAGYTLLSALCVSAGPDVMKVTLLSRQHLPISDLIPSPRHNPMFLAQGKTQNSVVPIVSDSSAQQPFL